ncbi:MAG: thioredoxin domain-containing protein [Flavobacteriales bacterium]|nr:thioredoxin domain-containing protein [Flavobacteriales bacterium]
MKHLQHYFPLFLSTFLFQACHGQHTTKNEMTDHKHTNALINETSPYLLQHAHNPVDWVAWNDESLAKAKAEQKPILVSIGYSACHWCHVMEHESFEDSAVAAFMNEHFICIKVDREERPDVDAVYMSAVQLMTGRGGWPLNCFALPDGRPLYGGTYFPKEQWMDVMAKVASIWENDREKALEYATNLTKGVAESELIQRNSAKANFTKEQVHSYVEAWKGQIDNVEGGPNRAPKFPLPNNYEFLLRYATLSQDKFVLDHVSLTLEKMAFGGIYDQVGGGFARYSTDELWKAPHFEKMLYDNGQLVSFYSEAYQATKNPLYKEIVEETLEYVKREMTTNEGAFYSALDADSEGEEGKFYVWKKEELQALLGADFDWVKDYYNINAKGLWEHDNYILLRKDGDEVFAKKQGWKTDELKQKVKAVNALLLKERDKRIRPGLDDKQLTSWNALMLKGYADAYRAFGEKAYLDAALKNAEFIIKKQKTKDGGLLRNHKEGRSTINGFLEDYCFTIEAFISLYQATFDRKWLDEADALAAYTIEHFHDAESGMFFFNSNSDSKLIARKMELTDNVMPSSNSSMAKGLFYLGHYFDKKEYLDISEQMLNNVAANIGQSASWYSNWLELMLHHTFPFYEVAIVGKEADAKRAEMEQHYHPNKLLIGGLTEAGLPLLQNKLVKGDTRFYVCVNKACQMPTSEVSEAIKQLQ